MIERTILSNLVYSEGYTRRVLPFLSPDYFSDNAERTLFEITNQYINKYNGNPSVEALRIELESVDNLGQSTYDAAVEILDNLSLSPVDEQWLVDTTEKFCQDKALRNGILKSIELMDGHESLSRGAIPGLLTDALAVSFNNAIGHDYFEDAVERYQFYCKKEDRIPFDLDIFNLITNGGLPKKTLNVILAGTGVGKTLFMCHAAAAHLMAGKNVLYVTCEMAEERIAERIDANLLDVTIDQLQRMDFDLYKTKIGRVHKRTVGKLVVKEFPTGTANANHIRHLLHELKLKKNFVPDVIYIDYLNICASVRFKGNAKASSYEYIKSIAEELRGLAVEFNVPIITATQTNRSGYDSTDVDLTDTSESFGLPMTADFMIALSTSEELSELGQMLVKQLKNRYGDPDYYRRFVIGVDRPKMRLYNIETDIQPQIAQTNKAAPKDDNHDEENRSVFDASKFGKTMTDEAPSAFKSKFRK